MNLVNALSYSQPPAWSAPPPLGSTPRPIPESAQIRVGERGYIHGVDGMLDQVAGALMRNAGPMLVRDVLPAVREDRALQARVGAAVGQEVARQVQPWLAIGAGALGILALLQLGKWYGDRRRAAGARR